MSNGPVAALVCEGQTDVPILRAMLQSVWPELDAVRSLQPDLDETDRARKPAGWGEVKRWCESYAGKLDEIFDPDLGDPIDLLLVAVDVDIAVEAGIVDPPRKKKVGAYEGKRLRDVIEGWLSTSKKKSLPRGLIVSTPVIAIESWIIAALFPKERAPEKIADPAEFLVEKKKLRRSEKDDKPWKELHRYQDFGAKVGTKLKRIRETCPEAERTMHAVEQLRGEDADE